ncbi:glycoside hydrolase family 127 protein [Lacibacter sp.]|uniref:glycoside hydrolase family 127 protein n=1 Tax=Lacibacter sp. TaxID=1915409 RepID=UPI002B4AC078|nr:glycoside hydrolase family 127 protein [Lacibacter sp.]HLP37551.1 glycoside hydrolase family 127 protein [Lacibacter sp.]
MSLIRSTIQKKLLHVCIGGLCLLQTVNAQDKLYPNAFALQDVQLLKGPFQHARDLNIQTLLQYDTDRLLAGYRKEAGLPAKATIFANWDGLDGHVGGHYLSALAMNYAATGNAECKRRMEYMIAELKQCMDANAKLHPSWAVGYVGAVPNGKDLWPKIKEGDASAIWKYWVPWYNVHKMYAGLKDAWMYAGDEDAKKMFLQFCDWAIEITKALSDAKMEEMLGNEHGGMNEVFADAYQITGDQKYLFAAKRFSHRQILEPLSVNKDELDNKHANTQVPKAIGFQRIGELANDQTYLNAGSFFWETVTKNRTLAFGGNSRREFFPSVAASHEFVNEVEGPESCNSYNMLKLTQDLFRLHPSAKYIDYYERTLYNHILSTQHPEHGGYVYFTPARPRHYRVYSTPNEAMWCCVGSGMENHGKYNEFIYTHQNDSLFLNLFIASELNWKKRGVKLKQETNFPYEEQTKLTVTEGASSFSLLIRYPSWVKQNQVSLLVNGKPVQFQVNKDSYISLRRNWKKGDVVLVKLPMQTRIETMPNVPEYIAFLHGPVLLAAKTGTEDLKGLTADNSRWGHIAHGKKLPIDQAPVIVSNNQSAVVAAVKPVKGKPLHFTLSGVEIKNNSRLELQPFYQLHDARYMMYWMRLTSNQYKHYIDSLTVIEQKRIELQKRTVDAVTPGEQQPEADHFIQQNNSTTGNYLDAFWRSARSNGYFSYQLSTNSETTLKLLVRYWGAEKGNRTFDIYVDDEKLITENINGKWNVQQFREVEYAIPASMLKGKKTIRVKFQALQEHTAGAVYDVRLVKK